jgi:hypothetical protein
MLLPSSRFLPRLLTLLATAVLPVAAVAQTGFTGSLTSSSPSYQPTGGELTLSFNTTYTGTNRTAYALIIELPTGWGFLNQTLPAGLSAAASPEVGFSTLEWGFSAFPANGFTLQFNVSYPTGLSGPQTIAIPTAQFRSPTTDITVPSLSLTSASPIPEPSTYAAIAGAGALALAFWRRRQSRRSAAQETDRAGSA